MAHVPLRAILFDIGGVVVSSPFQAILDYEFKHSIPPGWVNYCISHAGPFGYWQQLETGKVALDDAFYAGFGQDLHNPRRWAEFVSAQRAKGLIGREETLEMPSIDAKVLFNEMMMAATTPDPWVVPAIHRLRASGRYIIAALSNTVMFPPGHMLHQPDLASDPVRSLFDVFVSSAHVGLRKPDPEVYKLALREINGFAEQKDGHARIEAGEVVFLDDIGQNLKEARRQGFRTIKVALGRSREAIRELEAITGLDLEDASKKAAKL